MLNKLKTLSKLLQIQKVLSCKCNFIQPWCHEDRGVTQLDWSFPNQCLDKFEQTFSIFGLNLS